MPEPRTLLGVGYILLLIPLLNIVGLILVALGWYYLGKREEQSVWKVTGILGLLLFAVSLAALALLTPVILAAAASPNPEAVFKEMIALGVSGVVAAGLACIIGAVFIILMIVCLWELGSSWGSRAVKAGAVLYVLSLITLAAILVTPLAVFAFIMLWVLACLATGVGVLTAKPKA